MSFVVASLSEAIQSSPQKHSAGLLRLRVRTLRRTPARRSSRELSGDGSSLALLATSGEAQQQNHALPLSSRNRSSFCCTGRSEKENSTESASASCVTQCQLGTTNRSRGPHSKVCSPIRVRPLPSIAANTVASVER